MECKLFTKPQFHDEAFYKDRAVSDHINEPGHRERLLEVRDEIVHLYTTRGIHSISDYGAGNGGLLCELKKLMPNARLWGYDLSPKAVQYAREVYDVDVTLNNIETGNPQPGDIVILTELLEHVIEPHRLLDTLLKQGARWIVASSPAGETPQKHYEFHNWCWLGTSYAQMFERIGWEVVRHYIVATCGTQFLVARNPGLY